MERALWTSLLPKPIIRSQSPYSESQDQKKVAQIFFGKVNLPAAKVYTELPLKRAICLYMGTIGEAPEVSRGPISYLL